MKKAFLLRVLKERRRIEENIHCEISLHLLLTGKAVYSRQPSHTAPPPPRSSLPPAADAYSSLRRRKASRGRFYTERRGILLTQLEGRKWKLRLRLSSFSIFPLFSQKYFYEFPSAGKKKGKSRKKSWRE